MGKGNNRRKETEPDKEGEKWEWRTLSPVSTEKTQIRVGSNGGGDKGLDAK